MNARCEIVASEHTTGAKRKLQALAPSMQVIADLLRACLGADACLIAIKRSGGRRVQLYGTYEKASQRGSAVSQAAQALLGLPGEPVLVNGSPVEDSAMLRTAAVITAVAQVNQVNSFMCLPLRVTAMKARVCIASQHGCFTPVDLGNLALVAEQVSRLIECIHFGEQLVTDLTGHERRQISRDLHDSTIQPLIGLKLGLEALRRRLSEDHYLVKDLDDLIGVAAGSIGELREYVGALRSASRSGAVHT
jgi:signal transduction histidine kinase